MEGKKVGHVCRDVSCFFLINQTTSRPRTVVFFVMGNVYSKTSILINHLLTRLNGIGAVFWTVLLWLPRDRIEAQDEAENAGGWHVIDLKIDENGGN